MVTGAGGGGGGWRRSPQAGGHIGHHTTTLHHRHTVLYFANIKYNIAVNMGGKVLRLTQSKWRSACLRPQREGTLGSLLPSATRPMLPGAWYNQPAPHPGLDGQRPRVPPHPWQSSAPFPQAPDTPGAHSRIDFCLLQAGNHHPVPP